MKTHVTDISTMLLCQLIDQRHYEKGNARKSHRWVWKTKAYWLGISYQTYLRNINRAEKTNFSVVPPKVMAGMKGIKF